MNYKETLALPKTDFPMKANLTQREPVFLERWEKTKLYEQILNQNKSCKPFLLHDGPPYANGHIHLGHVMNKTLKDIVVKSKNMSGFFAFFVPGWDCHGLPIELQLMKELGGKGKSLSKVEFRKACRKYAEKFLDIQREDFKRIEVFGDWDHPYRTMDFSYQAQIVREFGKIVEKGHVYRTRRAIHWCLSCQTALAEAEIEYADHRSPSVYVQYPVIQGWEKLGLPATPVENRFALIWTTTPWTLPASMAIAFNPGMEYVVVEKTGNPYRFLMAKELMASMSQTLGLGSSLKIIATVAQAESLSQLRCQHPFLKREIPFLPGQHVTADTGTGLVHTAPGHGEEDYELGLKYGIEIYSPVGPDGRFEKEVEEFSGQQVFEANPQIVQHLKTQNRLFENAVEINHSYPHCWRCKKPLIFRATEQWFLRLSHGNLREKALKEIDRVKWVPAWGRDRIYQMIEARPDWCLSRQRSWGVPIPALVCKKCKSDVLEPSIVFHVADLFEKEGADVWFAWDVEKLIPPQTKCPKCGSKEFSKSEDILDVWFDSGASHAAVLEKRENLQWPCDLYLEGSDQYRGWFHSSLLESVATRGQAPYSTVITHGFTVDGQGRKMSKSLGNVISAQDMVKQKGAEMLRLWVAMEDYRDDVRLSNEIMDRVVESYRRIRNTARFCLGNLFDFYPDTHCVEVSKMPRELDRWAMDRLAQLAQKISSSYERYEFHSVVSALNEFCVVDMSSLYLDISKDCLYCDPKESLSRRSAQTVLFHVVDSLSRFIAPILSMTAEEIWDHLPAYPAKAQSVHLSSLPSFTCFETEEFCQRWEKIFLVRAEVYKALELLRQKKSIGQSLEAKVEVCAPSPFRELLESVVSDLPMLWIVSQVAIVSSLSSWEEKVESEVIPGLVVGCNPIQGNRCERCWTYASTLGSNPLHPQLCKRCEEAVRAE